MPDTGEEMYGKEMEMMTSLIRSRINRINGFRGYIRLRYGVNTSIVVIDKNTAKIAYLFSRDRGVGNGSAALDKILAFLDSLGFTRVLLEVHRNIDRLTAWYEKHGFNVVNRENGIVYMERVV